MNKLFNDGFVEPKITETHYIEGDGRLLGATVLNPSANWEKSLPDFEYQAKMFETYGCTDWGLENQMQTHHKYLYGEEINYDERYIYNLVPINPPGADPQDTYEAARRFGMISGFLPMTETLEEFKKPRPMTEPYLAEGKKWNLKYFFDHDWVLTGEPDPEKLRTKLKDSSLGVSVTAWIEENGVYVDKGQPNTHWCLLYKMDDTYYYIFDSYEPKLKRLPIKDHKICYAKRIVFRKRTPEEVKELIHKQQLNIFSQILELLYQYVLVLKKSMGEIITGVFSKKN